MVCETIEWVFFSSRPIISNYKNKSSNRCSEMKHVNHFAHHSMIIVRGMILLLLMFYETRIINVIDVILVYSLLTLK